jgi:hypothetical protein
MMTGTSASTWKVSGTRFFCKKPVPEPSGKNSNIVKVNWNVPISRMRAHHLLAPQQNRSFRDFRKTLLEKAAPRMAIMNFTGCAILEVGRVPRS